MGKESACSAGNMALTHGSGRSSGGEHSNLLQYILYWRVPWTRITKSPSGCKESDMTEKLSMLVRI